MSYGPPSSRGYGGGGMGRGGGMYGNDGDYGGGAEGPVDYYNNGYDRRTPDFDPKNYGKQAPQRYDVPGVKPPGRLPKQGTLPHGLPRTERLHASRVPGTENLHMDDHFGPGLEPTQYSEEEHQMRTANAAASHPRVAQHHDGSIPIGNGLLPDRLQSGELIHHRPGMLPHARDFGSNAYVTDHVISGGGGGYGGPDRAFLRDREAEFHELNVGHDSNQRVNEKNLWAETPEERSMRREQEPPGSGRRSRPPSNYPPGSARKNYQNTAPPPWKDLPAGERNTLTYKLQVKAPKTYDPGQPGSYIYADTTDYAPPGQGSNTGRGDNVEERRRYLFGPHDKPVKSTTKAMFNDPRTNDFRRTRAGRGHWPAGSNLPHY